MFRNRFECFIANPAACLSIFRPTRPQTQVHCSTRHFPVLPVKRSRINPFLANAKRCPVSDLLTLAPVLHSRPFSLQVPFQTSAQKNRAVFVTVGVWVVQRRG